jgi:hypothetical protein
VWVSVSGWVSVFSCACACACVHGLWSLVSQHVPWPSVFPATIDLENVFKNVLDSGEFEAARGGAKFEVKLDGVFQPGDELVDFSLGFIDGLKKAVVLFSIVSIVSDLAFKNSMLSDNTTQEASLRAMQI